MFDDSLNFQKADFRQHPGLYRIGKGEQGVLLIESCKSKLLPRWKFKTVAAFAAGGRILWPTGGRP